MSDIKRLLKNKYVRRIIKAFIAFLIIFPFLILKKNSYFSHETVDYNVPGAEGCAVSLDETVTMHVDFKHPVISIAAKLNNDSDTDAEVTVTLKSADGEVLGEDTQTVPAASTDYILSFYYDMEYDYTSTFEDAAVVFSCESDNAAEAYIQVSDDELSLDTDDVTARITVVYILYQGTFKYVVAAAFMIALMSVFGLYILQISKPEQVFLYLSAIMGTCMLFIYPALQEPDFIVQLIRSFDISYGNIFGDFTSLVHPTNISNVPNNVWNNSIYSVTPGEHLGFSFFEHLNSFSYSDEYTGILGYSGKIPVIYWPQALGLFLGRVLGLNAFYMLLLARFLNLAVYTAIVYFAIRLIPMGRNVLMAIALMPISMSQAASLSQDAMINALGFLFTALCLRYAYSEDYKDKQLGIKHMLLPTLILYFLFRTKYIYILMGLLVFMIPVEHFGGKKRYMKLLLIAAGVLMVLCIIAFLPNLKWILFNNSTTVTSTTESAASDTETMTQLGFLLAHPKKIVSVLYGTIYQALYSYLISLNMLGSIVYSMDLLIILSPCLIVGVSALDFGGTPVRRRDKWIMMAAFLAVSIACFFAIYIADSAQNPVGASFISGIQGRYFIVVLPLLLAAISSGRIKNNIWNFSNKVGVLAGSVLAFAFIKLIDLCY